MNDDAALLRRYAEEKSEPAFAELVGRHLNLVYSAALRRTNDAHSARDVAQQVFTKLARDASVLPRDVVLSGWLYTATRNAAIDLIRAEQRRKHREHAAHVMQELSFEPANDAAWLQIRTVLDGAMDELGATDREAVLLRFFEQRPFAEIGRVLKLSEDAARMRVERALDKLHGLLAKRGITSTAAALSVALAARGVLAAPAGLAGSITAAALAGASTMGASVVAVLLSFMNAKLITAALIGAGFCFGAGLYVGLDYVTSQPLPPLPETARTSQLITSLRAENARLNAEIGRLSSANANAKLEAARVAEPVRQALVAQQQQRAMLNNLRQIAAARDQFFLENGRPPMSLAELVGEEPKKYIHQIVSVNGEDYSAVSLQAGQPMTVTASDGTTATYEQTPEEKRERELTERVRSAVGKAVAAYRAANNGTKPKTPEALLPFFATPQEGADFIEMLEAQKELRKSRTVR